MAFVMNIFLYRGADVTNKKRECVSWQGTVLYMSVLLFLLIVFEFGNQQIIFG